MQPESDDGRLVEEFVIPAPKLPYDQPGTAYVAFRRTNLEGCILGSFSNTLKFVVKDCDPSTGEYEEEGYEDEYMVNTWVDYVIIFYFIFILNLICYLLG